MITKKWLKYEILIKYGLSTREELDTQIKRYQKSEIDRLYKDILKELGQNNTSYIYVLKLVPKELRFKLKNYKIYEQKDLEITVKDLNMQSKFEEIWCCKTKLGLDGGGIYGRFYINSGGKTEVFQCIEQVWSDTARTLEKILKEQEITYIEAKRIGWGWRYNIEEINCKNQEKRRILNDFWEVAKQIEIKRNKLEKFANDLYKIGICSFDIEYKMINGRIVIIDWDTSFDEMVLEELL